MSRWVIPTRPGLKAGKVEQPDGGAGRVVKYIPGEIVSAFTLLFTPLVSLSFPPNQVQWSAVGLIAFFFVITVAYVAKNTAGEVRKAHLIVSPIAFFAWAYPISSAALGDLFHGILALAAQAAAIGLSLLIKPHEAGDAPPAPRPK